MLFPTVLAVPRLPPTDECRALSVFGRQASAPLSYVTLLRHNASKTLKKWRFFEKPCHNAERARQSVSCGSYTPAVDRTVEIKISLSRSTGKLDFSDCELLEVPAAVFEVEDLTELSLAGNNLTSIPSDIGRLTALERLQLSGNLLTELPKQIGQLVKLQGLWLHGNLLASLPNSIGQLAHLKQLSLAGNRLQLIPDSIGQLEQLQELVIAGNQLGKLPESIGAMSSLVKLTLHGNRLHSLPSAIGQLQALEELWLQGNVLGQLPNSFTHLKALRQCSLADNMLTSLPPGLDCLVSLTSLWLYGNQLASVPLDLLCCVVLNEVWVESNVLGAQEWGTTFNTLAGRVNPLKALGVDTQQVSKCVVPLASELKVGEVVVCGGGYFKLQTGAQAGCMSFTAKDGTKGDRVLVVAFGSAPGVPNWGGLLSRVYKEADEEVQRCFDVLYVVDPHRSWYQGGECGEWMYMQRLKQYTRRYNRVLMLGDSMGATAALMAAPLATAVHAFCPQVDLRVSSIRPAQCGEWFDTLRARCMAGVADSSADVMVHCGTWSHDLDQAKLLPSPDVQVKVYRVNSHRLALYLDSTGKLLPLIRAAITQQMGLKGGQVRLQNLV